MRQCEPQRIKGWFYLPERPDDRRPGVLTWQPDDGATLELIGGFSPEPEYQKTATGGLYATQIVGDVRPGTIYGESDSGQEVTVWDAERGRYTAGLMDGIHDEFWHSPWICVGAHIPSPQEPAFTRTAVTIDELYYLTDDGRFCAPQWAPIEGVEHPGETQPNGTLLTPYIFPLIGGYRAEYAVGDTTDAHYSVATTATRPWLSQATEAMPDLKLQMMTTNLRRGQVVKLQVGAHVSIRLPDNAFGSAADFLNRMAPIDDLVQLATFEACGTEQITLDAIDGSTASLLMHVGKLARPDDVHEPAAVVFTLADVLLDRYLEVQQRLTDGNQASYAWSVLVGLCGYSSRMVEEYVSQALAAAEGFQCWCLKGGDSVSLNARLKALHAKLAPEIQAALGLDTEQWASWAVWARNHVAHGGTKTWRPPLRDSLQLHVVAESVHLVTYLAALQELGVPVGKVRDALINHPRLQLLAQRSSRVNELSAEPPSGDTAP
jgi:hypothetical protein